MKVFLVDGAALFPEAVSSKALLIQSKQRSSFSFFFVLA